MLFKKKEKSVTNKTVYENIYFESPFGHFAKMSTLGDEFDKLNNQIALGQDRLQSQINEQNKVLKVIVKDHYPCKHRKDDFKMIAGRYSMDILVCSIKSQLPECMKEIDILDCVNCKIRDE